MKISKLGWNYVSPKSTHNKNAPNVKKVKSVKNPDRENQIFNAYDYKTKSILKIISEVLLFLTNVFVFTEHLIRLLEYL